MIIDSHCHLSLENNTMDIENILKRARSSGVSKYLNIATKSNDFETLIDISNRYDDIFFTLGIHPHESKETNDDILQAIKNNLSNTKLLGIGETGLDFYYNHSDKKTQIKSLEYHITLAQESKLPLIIHMRDAENELIKVFAERMKKSQFTGVIHCFTGSLKFAKCILEMGFYISASGIITFKNSENLRNTFKEIPLNRLLVETDSPYLAPVPNRGKKNEPSFITHTVQKLCEIHNIKYDKMCDLTSMNFKNLFKRIND
tara:strand:+ start:220 stop:996 length:777 start_codon:yes stop_codon:yes gene_type:complete